MKHHLSFGSSLLRFFLILLAFLSISVSSSHAEFSSDAIILTLRNQSGVFLDSTMAAEIDSGLTIVRSEIDTLQSIPAFLDYLFTKLIVVTDASWNEAWKQGELLTGETFIDQQGTTYGLTEVHYHLGPWGDEFDLIFAEPLQMILLSDIYRHHLEIIYADPVLFGGDGDNIEYFKKDGILHFAFSRGWGDCWAGCIHRYYWYVSVDLSDSNGVVQLEEEKYRDLVEPYIYRWNIPDFYAMSMFENADSILQAIADAPEWWVRRHAIEGTWRFFVNDSPWVHEDNEQWNVLQDELKNRVADVHAALQAAVNDPDPDVAASALYALTQITPLSAEEVTDQRPVFTLHQNYPNPFNASTTIPYQLNEPSNVTILIYNILGQRVRELVSTYQPPGYYLLSWDGKDQFGSVVASGIYLCRIKVGRHEKTMRMLFLK
jgi:hypothetical protein